MPVSHNAERALQVLGQEVQDIHDRHVSHVHCMTNKERSTVTMNLKKWLKHVDDELRCRIESTEGDPNTEDVLGAYLDIVESELQDKARPEPIENLVARDIDNGSTGPLSYADMRAVLEACAVSTEGIDEVDTRSLYVKTFALTVTALARLEHVIELDAATLADRTQMR
jgi:hypothetical protein